MKKEFLNGTGQIVNARIVLSDSVLDGATCRFSNGIIEYIGKEALPSAPTVDAEGGYLMPGFIDTHCHGGAGYDFMDASPEEMLKIADFHLSHGTTTLVATTMTDRMDAITSALDRFAELGEDRGTLHGVHLEGPWLNPLQCGAQDTAKMALPNKDAMLSLLEKYPFIEKISAAPEMDGGMELGRIGADRGVVMSIAHTDADFDQTVLAADNGYSLVTHLYSGMRGVTRINAFRVAGCVEGALFDDRLTCELIADGCHLPLNLLRYIYKVKGADRICLVTDAMRGAGSKDGEEVILGRLDDGVRCIVEDGVAKLPDRQSFAGSVATTDRLMRVMHEGAGVDIVSVSKMLSGTPAALMGYTDRGRIERGLRADLIIVDKKLNINKIFLKGEQKTW